MRNPPYLVSWLQGAIRDDAKTITELRVELAKLSTRKCANCKERLTKDDECALGVTITGQPLPLDFMCSWWGMKKEGAM